MGSSSSALALALAGAASRPPVRPPFSSVAARPRSHIIVHASLHTGRPLPTCYRHPPSGQTLDFASIPRPLLPCGPLFCPALPCPARQFCLAGGRFSLDCYPHSHNVLPAPAAASLSPGTCFA